VFNYVSKFHYIVTYKASRKITRALTFANFRECVQELLHLKEAHDSVLAQLETTQEEAARRDFERERERDSILEEMQALRTQLAQLKAAQEEGQWQVSEREGKSYRLCERRMPPVRTSSRQMIYSQKYSLYRFCDVNTLEH
jgi:hypothetical protein